MPVPPASAGTSPTAPRSARRSSSWSGSTASCRPTCMPYTFGDNWLFDAAPGRPAAPPGRDGRRARRAARASTDPSERVRVPRLDGAAATRRCAGTSRTPAAWYEWVVADVGRSPLIDAALRLARGALARRRGRRRPELGRLADRQRACTATSSRSRCSTGRWPRVGPRELDVAWMVFAHRVFEDIADDARAAGHAATSCGREDVVATYERASPGYALARPRLLRRVRARSSGASSSSAPAARQVHFGEQRACRRTSTTLMLPPPSQLAAHARRRRTSACAGPARRVPDPPGAAVDARTSATSDRNFYDRCYFNAHDRTGDIFLVTGLGVYPNLGVIDAYATRAHAATSSARSAAPTRSATTGWTSRSARTASR